MTTTQFKAAQAALNLTNQQLADRLKVGLRTIERYRAGDPIPGPVEVCMKKFAEEY